ncbi:MAG: hypothetical protein E7E54_06865, partial [Varibaculum cambriense]|uniref:hypothetical protein n=1 Tax=Varibaculum cambriense TaxID=184870 RepID=UPI0028FF3A29
MSEKSNEPRQPDLFSAAMPAPDNLDQPDPKEKPVSSPSKTVTARPQRKKAASSSPETVEEKITHIDVSEEMRTSFLEYAYSVIYARALPDARDGLKPVQRR